MIKFICLGFILLILTSPVFGQLKSGSLFPDNIQAVDINGNNVDLFADLNSGKTVIIDIFATWCQPCWRFHQSGILKTLYNQYGPEGTDQLRIYGIEGDFRTSMDHIFQQIPAMGSDPGSLGDWSEGVNYNIINSHEFLPLFKFSGFPELYLIRPDKKVMDMFNYSDNIEIWKSAIESDTEMALIFSNSIPDKSFCTSAQFNAQAKMLNLGQSIIRNVHVDFIINGVSDLLSFEIEANVFEEVNITLPIMPVTETTLFEVKIVEVDEIIQKSSLTNQLKTEYLKPVTKENEIIIRFTTDFYPGELSWSLRDDQNRTLFSVSSYTRGSSDVYGGGGPDANKTFSYSIILNQSDMRCLTINIFDSGGDGFDAFDSNLHATPGVEILTVDGSILKPKFNSDFSFTSSKNIEWAVDFTSANPDTDLDQSLKIFPNPVHDILNIDISQFEDIDFDIYVTDLFGNKVSYIVQNKKSLVVSNLFSGFYILHIHSNKGVITHRFFKT